MLVPTINLVGGRAVQLAGGDVPRQDAGDPTPIARRFGFAPEATFVDVDAVMERGNNTALIESLLPLGCFRVGGGIRSYAQARRWLDLGAHKIIIGTAAAPELFKKLPKDRVIASFDSEGGEVVVNGRRVKTQQRVSTQMKEFRDNVSGFLVTFIDRSGRMQGTRLEEVGALIEAAGDARLTVAGGIRTADEIAHLDRMGADAQVGMALQTGQLDFADALSAPLNTDRLDGLWPTVVVDTQGVALGLVYSSLESLQACLEEGVGVFHSRKRGLWRKEGTRGSMKLVRIDLDCDRDTLRIMVQQENEGFCTSGTWTCFGHLHHAQEVHP